MRDLPLWAEDSEANREIEALMALHPKGFDLSLGRITRLLENIGNPHLRLPPVIHIAGTNGKGSCAAFSRAMLEAAGYRVHVHTSPHLVRWHERFRLAGQLVDDKVLADAVRRVAKANNGDQITVFEILTAVMFLLFAEHEADVAIIEVGLGGRADATNVIDEPAVSVIMPIGLDHEAYLGTTVEKIAAEKGGIIKRRVPVVIGAQPHEEARDVLERMAAGKSAQAYVHSQDFTAYEEHGRLVWQGWDRLLDLPLPRLPGRHQIANLSAAIAALYAGGFHMSAGTIEQGIPKAQWPARLQQLTEGRLVDLAPEGSEIWLDGGHNPAAALNIAEFLAEREDQVQRDTIMIAGMINTKDSIGYFREFAGLVRDVLTVPITMSDAGVPADELADHAEEAGLSAEPMENVETAISTIADYMDEDAPPPRIIICGSLYFAGEVLQKNGTIPT